jgi:hypothetical protein
MKKPIIAVLSASFLFLLFTSSQFSQDDPDGKAGVSGAPGENTCNDTDCHNSFALNSGAGSITISSSDLTNWVYTPGMTYSITVTVAQSNINLFGLCFEALKPNGDNAGTLVAGNDTQIKLKTVGGFQRKSITHDNNTGATANSHSFTFNWTAPTTNMGDITFYAAGIAANGDDHESNDQVYSTSQVVTATGVGLMEIADQQSTLAVYPNPASHAIRFTNGGLISMVDAVTIIDSHGRTIQTQDRGNWQTTDLESSIDISTLNPGFYTACFSSKGRIVQHANFQKTGL